jgi:hypothetical protein
MIRPVAVRIDLCGLGGIRLHTLCQGKRVHLAQFGVVLNDGGVRAVTKYDPRPFGAGFPARSVVRGVEIIDKTREPACRGPSCWASAEFAAQASRQRLSSTPRRAWCFAPRI